MIDPEEFLIPLYAKKALLVSDTTWGLEELEGLLTTLGGVASDKIKLTQNSGKGAISPKTYIRQGKLEEIARRLEASNLDLLLVDFDLSPTQLKNIEQKINRLVLDRSGIILEIFNRHAKTKEAKLQVSLARMQYLMPRLTHLWSHFERQRGSGGGALKGKGMGEKQIEVDRRLVKNRIHFLQQKLNDVERARSLHRKHRQEILKVAIVGYTNAGKSTLLNALTLSQALVEDALFATLDAQVKLLNPKVRPAILAIDTVGFIDRLPHTLVASFRSTLSEVLEADLLVHVLDASHPEVKRHFEVTTSVLEEIANTNKAPTLEIPTLLVFNKVDKIENHSGLGMLRVWSASMIRMASSFVSGPLFISALDPNGVNELRDRILQYFEQKMQTYELVIPYADGKAAAQLHEFGRVLSQKNTEHGTFYRIRTMPEFANRMGLERYLV